MILILLLLILLPLALTSPHVSPYVHPILANPLPYSHCITDFIRKQLHYAVNTTNNLVAKVRTSRRVKLLRDLKKHPLAKKWSKQWKPRWPRLLPKGVQLLLTSKFLTDRMSKIFIYLFIFKYLRLIVHLISFWLYTSTPVPKRRTICQADCTVILRRTDPTNRDFEGCLTSCLINEPNTVLIVTLGSKLTQQTKHLVAPYKQRFPHTKIMVLATYVPNQHIQIVDALQCVHTKITVLLNEHVLWPSPRFLPALIVPFEDSKVGVVGTNKRVRRTETGFTIWAFWNMVAALNIERQNFENRALNAIDGGVSVVEGYTSAHRSMILTDPKFIRVLADEPGFFGLFGPLNTLEDNFITRWTVKHGFKAKIQHCNDALIEATLGSHHDFLSHCLQSARSTWRNNSASLFTNTTVWYRQPWSVYALYLTSFVNFALFYDGALIYTILNSNLGTSYRTAFAYLLYWIFVAQIVEVFPHYVREPQDILMLPGYLLFSYIHSLIKLYAALTFWVTNSRKTNHNGSHNHPRRVHRSAIQQAPPRLLREEPLQANDNNNDPVYTGHRDVTPVTPVRRGPGRPRKDPAPAPALSIDNGDAGMPVNVKSPLSRARARASQAAPPAPAAPVAQEAAPPRRRPGRPRKNP